MRRLLILGVCLAAAIPAIAQGPVQHGIGDPRTLLPVPNCSRTPFYVDDSTGKLYQAVTSSPCTWVDPSTSSTSFKSAALLGTDQTGALAVTSQSQVNAAVGGNQGVVVYGDSIAAGTGSTPTPATSQPNVNGFAPILANLVGGPYFNYAVSGDQCADQNKNAVFTSANPVGSALDPVSIVELGTNDITRYTSTANQQQIFQRCTLANLSWLAIPQANKKFAQAATLAGGFAADTTVTQLQNGLGASCTTQSCTATFTFTSQTAGRGVYFWYLIKDSNGGTFTVSLNGSNVNDPFGGTSTWSNQGDSAALISTANGTTLAVAGGRLGVTTSGTNTIVVTGTSTTNAANIVEVYAVGIAPASSTSNPVVVAVSPNPQNNANTALVATYSGFVSSAVSTVSGDGLNAYFADTGSAMLNIPTSVTAPYTLTTTTQVIPGWTADGGVSYAGTPSTALTQVGSNPAQGQYSVSAGTYTINAADVNVPLLITSTVNEGSNSVATLATNCYSDGLIHPANACHDLMANVIYAAIPAKRKNGATIAYRPPTLSTVSASLIPVNPSQFWTPNPAGLNSSTAWNPGINFAYVNGNASGVSWQGATGLTLYFLNTGGTPAISFCPTVGANKQAPGPPPALATCYFQLQSNGLATFTIPLSVKSITVTQSGLTGTIALPTSAIAAGTCSAAATLAVGGSGVSSTTAFAWSFNSDPSAITGYPSLTVSLYGTSNTINVKVCNPTAGPITPSAATINVRAIF